MAVSILDDSAAIPTIPGCRRSTESDYLRRADGGQVGNEFCDTIKATCKAIKNMHGSFSALRQSV